MEIKGIITTECGTCDDNNIDTDSLYMGYSGDKYLNKCAMLDGELEKIKSEFKNGNISEDDYNKKIEKYIKQVIKILK